MPMPEDQKPAVALPTGIKPLEVTIPENVAGEIKRLHVDLVSKARAFDNARGAFGEVIRVAKQTLGISLNENWSIREDASAFVKLTNEGSRG